LQHASSRVSVIVSKDARARTHTQVLVLVRVYQTLGVA
jgi:hypothetical protein